MNIVLSANPSGQDIDNACRRLILNTINVIAVTNALKVHFKCAIRKPLPRTASVKNILEVSVSIAGKPYAFCLGDDGNLFIRENAEARQKS